MLFPIRIDGAVFETEEAWAAKIRNKLHIGDFSNWKEHDAYQDAFKRLLQDLHSPLETAQGRASEQ